MQQIEETYKDNARSLLIGLRSEIDTRKKELDTLEQTYEQIHGVIGSLVHGDIEEPPPKVIKPPLENLQHYQIRETFRPTSLRPKPHIPQKVRMKSDIVLRQLPLRFTSQDIRDLTGLIPAKVAAMVYRWKERKQIEAIEGERGSFRKL